jgi:hypothetical protein
MIRAVRSLVLLRLYCARFLLAVACIANIYAFNMHSTDSIASDQQDNYLNMGGLWVRVNENTGLLFNKTAVPL